MKHFHFFRSELRQQALSSLLGVSPAVSSAFSDTIHPRKLTKAFNQILVLVIPTAIIEPFYDRVKNPAGLLPDGIHNGEPPEIRTPDPLIKSQMLCQLS